MNYETINVLFEEPICFMQFDHTEANNTINDQLVTECTDIVQVDETVTFSLSELLLGLYPACVLPFLIRRIGYQQVHSLTLMTKPISESQALECGLVDGYEKQSEAPLHRHLLRLRRLSKLAIRRYKSCMNAINPRLSELRPLAVAGNLEVFSDTNNVAAIARYVKLGLLSWENA